MRTKELFAFMHERHAIYQRRAQGKPKPWTKDPILQQYRFCNVYRELDTVTQWIAKNWRYPHRNDPNLWFAMCVARLFNWPPTLQELGYPVPFKPVWIKSHTFEMQGDGEKVFSGAYIVSTNGVTMEKIPYVVDRVLTPLWADRNAIQADVYGHPSNANLPTLASVHIALTQYIGLGSFLAAQVIADLKYERPLRSAEDWYTWAASGPGSRRGLNRVLGYPIEAACSEIYWLQRLQTLHKEIASLVKQSKMPPLHAQDLQNCLCEFDKYERTRLGEGRPRSRYPGGA